MVYLRDKYILAYYNSGTKEKVFVSPSLAYQFIINGALNESSTRAGILGYLPHLP